MDIFIAALIIICIAAAASLIAVLIKMFISMQEELLSRILKESQLWREAYVAKEYGSTSSVQNTPSSPESAERQPDMDQQDESTVEPSIQAEDYAHLVSKTAKTAVSFGEDVAD